MKNKDKEVCCIDCIFYDELSWSIDNKEKTPKDCRKCAHRDEPELCYPMKARPGYREV